MKKHAMFSFLAAAISLAGFAREPRKAVLIVQNHVPDKDVSIAFLALTDELTAALSGSDIQVINPYNSVGVNQNRDARGEKLPEVSAMELARRFKAEGMITASVVEFRETPPSGAKRKFTIKMVLNLADAQTGGVVCGAKGEHTTEKYTAVQIQSHRATYINDLMSNVLDKCTKKLLSDPLLREWVTTKKTTTDDRTIDDRTIFEKVVDELTVKMLSDSTFNTKYEELKTRCDRIPVVIIGGVKNESGRPDLDAGLKVAGQRFLDRLYKTKKFDIKADAATETAIAERLVKAVGTEKDDLIEELKQHGSPDLYVVWKLIYSTDLDGTGYYNFVLTISHLRRPGGVFWTDLHTLKMPIKEVAK